MKTPKPDPKLHQTIIENVKRLRIKKNFTSQEMAYKVGMIPTEYSKLENGHKPYIEKWLGTIAEVLEVDKYLLLMEELEKPSKNSYLSPEVAQMLERQREDFILFFKALDEKDKSKDDLIILLKEEKTYWKNKYYRCKERLEESEKSKQSSKVYFNTKIFTPIAF